MWFLVAWLPGCGTKDGGSPGGGSALCNVDADGDGFGSSTAVPATSCTDEGVADNAVDCDDEAASVHPGATETAADDIDQDCDGDDLCFEDLDGDAYGGGRRLERSCAAAGLIARDGDCDDADPDIHPGRTEIIADGVDQDCDGGDSCYVDSDGDGFGTSIPLASMDLDCADEGEADNTDDCLDVGPDGPATFPGAAENESDSACMTDGDGDGYGWSTPAEGVTPGRDCDNVDAEPCPVIHVGYDHEFPDFTTPAVHYLMGCRIYVNSSMTVTDLALIGKASGGNVRMALYTELDTMPDALVVEVPSTPVVEGVLEMPVDLTPIGVGYYWIMAIFDGSFSEVGTNWSPSGDCAYRMSSFSAPLPDPFGTAYPGDPILNYYIVGWE